MRRGRYLLLVLVLAAVYVAAGRLGLGLDAVAGFATLVWPPTGISLAALLVGGIRLWPGVAAGAFFVNLWAGAPVPVAGGIAFGNTLEAVVAAYALGRLSGFDLSLRRSRDAIALIVFGALLSTLLSATIGTLSLRLGGLISVQEFGVTWAAWWMGDAIANVILAPLLLSWGVLQRMRLSRQQVLEVLVLGVSISGAALLVFATPGRSGAAGFVQPYLLSPFMIWAAVRFLQRGATAATFVVAVIAIWGTALGFGPFTEGPLHERLQALQAFLAIMAMTFLVLGAVAAERTAAARELRVAKEEAEAASRAKSRFLAVVSHELRTPLNGILGYADLLLGSVGGSLGETQLRYVTRMRAAAWHLVTIIDGILTFSRGDAHRHDVQLEAADAAALLHDAVGLVTPHIEAKQLDVQLTLPDAPISTQTDPGKVRQILVNLIGNAVKFTTGRTIELRLERDDGWVTFTVSDHGPGIPADQLERIFEPFVQLGSTNPQLPAGTGLGLPVSRMLAELLGGTVSVNSCVGQGSTFTLRLPAANTARTSVPA